MRISDWSSDVCSSDLYRAQLDVERSACLAEHDGRRLALDRPEQLGIGVDGEVAARIVRIFRREFDIMLVLERDRRLAADELAILDADIQLRRDVGAHPEEEVELVDGGDIAVGLAVARVKIDRSEERRVGKGCGSKCRFRGVAYN